MSLDIMKAWEVHVMKIDGSKWERMRCMWPMLGMEATGAAEQAQETSARVD